MLLRNSTLRAILLPLTVCTVAVLAISALRHFLNECFFVPQDEGILLVYPDLILRGYIPYRDFAALYSPAGSYLIAGLFQIFGETIYVERSLAVAYWSLLLVAAFLVGSRVNRLTAILAAATVLGYLALSSSPGAHTHFGAYVCILFAMALAGRNLAGNESLAKRVVLLSGVVSGATLWFKQDFGVVTIVATLVATDPRNSQRLRAFLGGITIPVCALTIFAIIVGPAAVFDSLILDPIRAAPGRFLPLHPGWGFGVVVACIAIQCVTAARAGTPRVSYEQVWLARGMATFSVGYFMVLLHRTSSIAILADGFSIICFTVISVSILFLHSGVTPRWRTIALVGFFLACMIPVGVIRLTDRSIDYPRQWVSSEGRTVPLTDADVSKGSDLQRLLDEINRQSRKGDGLFVGQRDLRFANHNDTFIYYLLPNLRPVSRYLEMNPGCANRPDSGLVAQLSGADWLILTTRFDDLHEPNASLIPGSAAPNKFVATHFCSLGRYGYWELLHRCSVGRSESSRYEQY